MPAFPLRIATVLIALTALLALAAAADEQKAEKEQAKAAEQQIDQEALELVKRVSEQVDRAENFTARIVHSFEMSGPGIEADENANEGENDDNNSVKQEAIYEFAFQEPNLMRLEVVEGEPRETMISDGEKRIVYIPEAERYVEFDAPDDMAQLLGHPGAFGGPGALGGPFAFAGMVLLPDFANAADNGLLKVVERIGTETVDGTETQRIRIVAVPEVPEVELPPDAPSPPEHDFQHIILDVWVEQRGDASLLRRAQLDFMLMMAQDESIAAAMEDYEIVFTTEFHDWEFDTEIPDDRFAFDPPEEAEQAETMRQAVAGVEAPDAMFELLIQAMMREHQVEADARPDPHKLVGTKAPNFELPLLDGSQMELIRHRGHDIVILDFWATWCGPCVRALPHLMSVAEEFSDQNVVLYAVNIREDHETVRSFLEEREWDLKVPMDTDRSVADLYHVRGIPQSVTIDTNGIIQAVHVGYDPDMEEKLRKEIQTLLDGASLVGE